jgi:hypothetical protein
LVLPRFKSDSQVSHLQIVKVKLISCINKQNMLRRRNSRRTALVASAADGAEAGVPREEMRYRIA